MVLLVPVKNREMNGAVHNHQSSGWEGRKPCPLCKDKAKEKNVNFSAEQLDMGLVRSSFNGKL